MRSLRDPDCLLATGLAAIRTQFKVPEQFPAAVEAAARLAAAREPSDHADRTRMPFVTLDPASSTDLDQAFTIEAASGSGGSDLLLHYAIADVAWFVSDGDPLDLEAWNRGETTYMPGAKAGLYPGALAGRIALADEARGAARVDPPEQEVERDAAGHFTLRLRPLGLAERRNAALSLATNLAVAQALLAARTGLFRVMAGPDRRAQDRLRFTAQAFGLSWPADLALAQFEKTLDPADPRAAAFMLALRKAGNGASYEPYQDGVTPWHAAIAASYCHVTAPLRRLADRYVIRAALALAQGQPVPGEVSQAFQRLGPVMSKSGARSAQVERAVIDLAEAAILAGREGETFEAVVTDLGEQGARIQLCELPVVARTTARRVMPGERITVRLDHADPIRREVRFSRLA